MYFSKRIEEIGKMTSLSQEDIMSNTKTVIQGLDTLKNEHHQILNGLLTSVKTIKKENGDTNLMEEKTNILKKSLETIELGLSEAQVSGQRCPCLVERQNYRSSYKSNAVDSGAYEMKQVYKVLVIFLQKEKLGFD